MTRLHKLFGPAASVLAAARALALERDRFALLLDGDPGTGKTHLADELAREIAGNAFAVEHVNGQSLGIDLVRAWRERAAHGNLFSAWTVKRIDEIDHASASAIAEMLTLLDYLPKGMVVIATTNEFSKLRAASKGRLESRFVRFHVAAPAVEETVLFLRRQFGIPAAASRAIAAGSVPEGCLATAGCNVRTAMNDAAGFLAARKAKGVA